MASTAFTTLKDTVMSVAETKKIKDLANDITAATKGQNMSTDFGVKIQDPENW